MPYCGWTVHVFLLGYNLMKRNHIKPSKALVIHLRWVSGVPFSENYTRTI
jgi:hypothetical protein